jgi:hypothetical protein
VLDGAGRSVTVSKQGWTNDHSTLQFYLLPVAKIFKFSGKDLNTCF